MATLQERAAQAAALANATGRNRAGGAIGGALKGAGTGAAIGSAVPVIGTAIGGALGGIAGGLSSLIPNKKDAERQRQINAFAAQLQDQDPGNDAAAMTALQGAASSWAGGGKQMAADALARVGQGGTSAPAAAGGGIQTPEVDPASNGGGWIDQAGSALRRLNGGKALTLGNAASGAAKNIAGAPGAAAGGIGSTLRRLNGGNALTLGNLAGGAARNIGDLAGNVGGFVKDNLGELAGAGVGALGVKEAMEADKLREQALGGIPEDSQLGLTAPDDSRYRNLAGQTDAALAGVGGGIDERLAGMEQGADRYRSLVGATDVNGRLSATNVQSQIPTGGVTGRLTPERVNGDLGQTDVTGRLTGREVSGDLGNTDVQGRLDPRAVQARSSNLTVDQGGEIAPEDSARLDRYRSLTDTAQGNLGGPDRTTLAKNTLADLEASTARERAKGIRDTGQAAAKFGRLGSGMVTTDLGNLEAVLQERSGQRANELAASVAEGDIGDRYRTLDATRSGESTIADEEARRRAELRGERSNVQDVATGNINRGQRAAEFGTGVDQSNEAARLAAGEANINIETGNVNRGMSARQFGVGVEEGNAARDLAVQQGNLGIDTGNVERGLGAKQFGVGVEADNAARALQAAQGNIGIETGNVNRAFDAGAANTALAERNAGRTTQADATNLDIEAGNVNRRVGVGENAAGFGADLAGAGVDDRYRKLNATAGLEGQAYDEMAGDRTFNQGQATNTFNRGISRAGVRGTFANARDDRADALITAGADLAGGAANRKAYDKAQADAADAQRTDAVAGWVRNTVGRLPGVSSTPTSTPTVRPNLAVQPGATSPITTSPTGVRPSFSVQPSATELPGQQLSAGGGAGRLRSLIPGGGQPTQPGAILGVPQQPRIGLGAAGGTGRMTGFAGGGASTGTQAAQVTPPLINQQTGAGGVSVGTALNPGGGGLGIKPVGQPMVPMQPALPAVGAPIVDPSLRRLRRKPQQDEAFL